MMATTSPSCTVCLEVVADNRGRSTARLQCGHHFHLDCIGSEFNMKGVMQCPNCRATEDGNWLYALGGEVEENDSDDEENENIIQMTSAEFIWCMLNGFESGFPNLRGAMVAPGIFRFRQTWVSEVPLSPAGNAANQSFNTSRPVRNVMRGLNVGTSQGSPAHSIIPVRGGNFPFRRNRVQEEVPLNHLGNALNATNQAFNTSQSVRAAIRGLNVGPSQGYPAHPIIPVDGLGPSAIFHPNPPFRGSIGQSMYRIQVPRPQLFHSSPPPMTHVPMFASMANSENQGSMHSVGPSHVSGITITPFSSPIVGSGQSQMELPQPSGVFDNGPPQGSESQPILREYETDESIRYNMFKFL